jgi:hypothetical protein
MMCEIAGQLVIDYRPSELKTLRSITADSRQALSARRRRTNMRCSKCGFDNPDGMKFCGQRPLGSARTASAFWISSARATCSLCGNSIGYHAHCGMC